jgi:putative (di)nucleoside polyphosphate hydrolase
LRGANRGPREGMEAENGGMEMQAPPHMELPPGASFDPNPQG